MQSLLQLYFVECMISKLEAWEDKVLPGPITSVTVNKKIKISILKKYIRQVNE